MKGWIFLCIFILGGSSGSEVIFPEEGDSSDGQEKTDVRLGLLAPLLGQHPIGKPLQQTDRTLPQPYIVNNPNHGCHCYPGYSCPTTTERPHNTDGTGLIDIRIVNRHTDGNKCNNGVLCCFNNNQNDDYSNPGSGSTYQCGTHNPFQGYSSQYGEAQFGEYPWVVLLLSGGKSYVGAGVLIDNQHILTVAHKVQRYTHGLVVRLGEWDAKRTHEPLSHVDIGVESVLVHPNFNAGNLKNDVAVLRLKHPVSYNRHIRPICLPQQYASFVGKRCWVAGWGKDAFGSGGEYTYIQKEVDVPVLSHHVCEDKLQQTRLRRVFHLDRKSFICAGGEEGKDSCTGDGGAPLVCSNNGRYYVVGLVAWGIGCAEHSVPGVYVNVVNYLNWIHSNT